MAFLSGMSTEEEMLRRTSPSKERREKVQNAAEALLQAVEAEASKYGYQLETILVGSVAKDTFLADPDIDVFVMFPPEISRSSLEKIGLKIGRAVIKGEERYAEHPYIHGVFQGFEADIVPCYKVAEASNLKSAVDRTPFHTQFIKKNLSMEQRGQVRLLKQFMKGIGVYGAESRIQGFSGYLIELLILKYGNFEATIKAGSRWKFNETLMLTQKKGKEFSDPLVFYDPVDSKRNVASALSVDSFALFIVACKAFLKNESENFFFPEEKRALSLKEIRSIVKDRGTSIIVASMERPDINDDNLYPQMRRTLEGTVALLRDHDFDVMDKVQFADDDRIYFVMELARAVLPEGRKHVGPPVWIANAQTFLEKWNKKGLSDPFIENGRWMVIARREYTSAKELLEKEMKKASLGSDLRRLKGLDVFTLKEARSRALEAPISALLDKRLPWEI